MRRPRLDIPPHPDAREPWFRELTPQRRAAMKLDWAQRLQRDELLVLEERKRSRRDGPAIGLVFAIGDGMCSFGSLGTALAAFLAGTLAGVAFSYFRWGPTRSAVGAMGVFLVCLLATRGGISLLFSFAWVAVALMTAMVVRTRD